MQLLSLTNESLTSQQFDQTLKIKTNKQKKTRVALISPFNSLVFCQIKLSTFISPSHFLKHGKHLITPLLIFKKLLALSQTLQICSKDIILLYEMWQFEACRSNAASWNKIFAFCYNLVCLNMDYSSKQRVNSCNSSLLLWKIITSRRNWKEQQQLATKRRLHSNTNTWLVHKLIGLYFFSLSCVHPHANTQRHTHVHRGLLLSKSHSSF